MPESQLVYIVVGLAVVVLIVVMQLKTRPLRENSATRLTVILGVIGVVEIYHAANGHPLGTWTVPWLAGSLIVGGALGAARAVTVRIWRTEDGTALVKGTAVTAALWIVSVAAHFALQVGIDHSAKIAGFGSASLLLYLAITLGAQRAVLQQRAASIGMGDSLTKAQLNVNSVQHGVQQQGRTFAALDGHPRTYSTAFLDSDQAAPVVSIQRDSASWTRRGPSAKSAPDPRS